MRTSDRTFRNVAYLVFTLMISVALAACGGGGGGGSTSPGTSGPAVSVSIASATSYPDGTTFATSTASPTTAAPPGNSPVFENVFVSVTKLALIPSTGPEFPDANGELEMQDSSADEGKGFVTATFSPVPIDLLHLSGDNTATLLNKFASVPAGEYSKIRVYYDNVVGQPGDVLFHQTAHYHFDVHFVGGNLVIPVTSDPGGGIEFYSVLINVVGKYHLAGKSPNVLLRPQVFATVVNKPIQYKVTGYADNVIKDNLAGTFDILLLDHVRTVPAAFYDNASGTTWSYSDNVFGDSPWIIARGKGIAVPAFQNRAKVSAIGVFDAGGRLQASRITFTFPDVREGRADNVWIPPDNTAFIVQSLTDNATVFPQPDRSGAYYDNLITHAPLFYTDLDNNLLVRTRGYFDNPEALKLILRSYWISIDGLYVAP